MTQPQHACIAIGIDRYRYLQPLRYALEDARDFHAAIAAHNALNALKTRASEPAAEVPTAATIARDWSQLPTRNDRTTDRDGGVNSAASPDTESALQDTSCLLLTEASPAVGDRSTYPTRENILHALYRWGREVVTPDRRLWCFFSGYGMEIDGIDYLLPVDADPERLTESAIDIETVFDALAAAPTDRVTLILDINRPTGADHSSNIGQQTYETAKARGIPTLLSCQPHQRSRETRDLRHGLFTAALLEALRQRQCPTLESLVRYLDDRVPELCELYLQPEQMPLWTLGDRATELVLDSSDAVADLDSTAVTGVIDNLDNLGGLRDATPATATDPELGDPIPTADRDTPFPAEDRSTASFLSSIGIWLGLFGTVLGLGIWLNAPGPETEPPSPDAASEPPSTEVPNPPELPSRPDAEVSISDAVSESAPIATAPATVPEVTPSDTKSNTNTERSLGPVMDPDTIAALHALSASPLDLAIARARALTPDDDDYARRDRDIARWGTTIFEIAQSRADRGEWMLAIAAARLVPPELETLQARANRSIDWWTQALVNEQIFNAARQVIEPDQVSSYWRGIEKLRSIQDGQPFATESDEQIQAWSAEMLQIARERVVSGRVEAGISAARLIPRDTLAYKDAQQDIERWQSYPTQ